MEGISTYIYMRYGVKPLGDVRPHAFEVCVLTYVSERKDRRGALGGREAEWRLNYIMGRKCVSA